MTIRRLQKHWLFLAGCTAFLATCWMGVMTQAQESETVQVTRAYRLNDLLANVNDYGFNGVRLPGVSSNSGYRPMGMGYGGGGGGAVGGGGGGGGVFSVPDQLIHNTGFTQLGGAQPQSGGESGFYLDDKAVITAEEIETILSELLEMSDRDVWMEGGIQQLGTTLIVTTTEKLHHQIEQHLTMIRESVSGTARSVTIRVTWLNIEDEQYDLLDAQTSDGVIWVNQERLHSLARESGATGSITCFDGQTVHLVSGHMQNWIKSATPVVGAIGQPEMLRHASLPPNTSSAQLVSTRTATPLQETTGGWQQAPSYIGYNPVSETINYGATLQITPITSPDGATAMLDVHSNIVTPINQTPESRTINFMNTVNLDRLHVRSQQFRTSLRVPVNVPVIVGGSTVQVGTGGSFYVILEVVTGR